MRIIPKYPLSSGNWAQALMLGLAFLMLPIAGADPIISEFMASNGGSIIDEDGDHSDWIEIHNPDASAVDMAGWHLTDKVTSLIEWTFPAVTIPAGGYLVVFASDKDRAVAGNELHTNFKLSAAGEYLALVKPDGVTATSVFDTYPAQFSDYSFGVPQRLVVTDMVVNEGAPLRYHVPNGAVSGWNTPGFDDTGASWSDAASGIGYERSSGGEYDAYLASDIEAETYLVHPTVYLRFSFNVADPLAVTAMNLMVKADDGFVAYLNGEFLASQNAPGSPVWSSKALSSVEANLGSFDSWDVISEIEHLNTGANVLAIQLLNQATNSSDLLMIPKLELRSEADLPPGDYSYFAQATPGSVNGTPSGIPSGEVSISVPSGVKSSAISVVLTTGDPGAEIRYTLDGSEPDESSQLYSAALSLSDPARLRARAFESGKSGGKVAVADYGFLDPSLVSYLADVPVIVMDNFGAGSYPNKGRSNDGRDVQQVARQANVMSYFDVAGNSQPFSQSPSLEARTGCRVRGSSSSSFPRKSLSVEFWDENDQDDNGVSPFGMPAEADWVLNAPYASFDESLVHNPVTFGFARMIGALAPECRVVVVFQNTNGGKVTASDLAGVHVFMEKVERKRMGLNFDELDATGTTGGWMINVDRMAAIPEGLPASTIQPNFHAAGPNGILQIPDDEQNSGGSQSVDDISEFYHSYLNFSSPDGYGILPAQRNTVQTEVRAMDAAVWANDYDDPVTGYAAHLDVDSWARFYAVQNFAKNNDAIVLSTYIFRESSSEKIKMGPVWDFDRAYTWNGSATSNPLAYSSYDWYEGLFPDVNFKQVHQDAWQEARRTKATNSALEALVDDAVAGLRPDQITASGLSYSVWQNNVGNMRDWVVERANYLDSQYEGLPTLSPPTREFSGSVVVTMAPVAGGLVYYTTDGTDPRALGGGVSASAQSHTGPLVLTERTHLIVRTKDGSRWSGKIEQDYYQLSELPQLVISEVAYHPADPTPAEIGLGFTNSDDFEYLEILNIAAEPVDLDTLALAGGIDFDFSSGSIDTLGVGSRVLVVANLAAFEARHGTAHPVAGAYTGMLNNAGDQIILKDAVLDIDFQNFSYDDADPWPTQADGDGYSLVLKQPLTDPNHSLASNWRGSAAPSGTPGGSDARPPFAGDPADDDDGDGVPALVEHFLGTSDQDSSQGLGRTCMGSVRLPSDGLDYPTLEITYAIGVDDVVGGVEWSGTLQSWDGSNASIILVSDTPDGEGGSTMVWRSTRPFPNSPQFFRLKVVRP